MSSSRNFSKRGQFRLGYLIGWFGMSGYLYIKQKIELNAQADKCDLFREKVNVSNVRSEQEPDKNIVNDQLNKIKECNDIISIAKDNLKKCEKYNEIASRCLFFCPSYFMARDCLKDNEKLSSHYKDCMSEVDMSRINRII